MPNLLFQFTRGFTEQLVPQSLTDLKSEADNIKDTLMQGGRTAQEKYREMRNSAGFKKVTDFFFHRSAELGSGSALDDNNDEFDSGFQFVDDTGGGDSSEPRVLDYEGMKDLTRSQVSSMYEIAGKQTEAAALNTSEIIASMNTRSSEILSSLGTINSSLTAIAGKLDTIIKLTTDSAKSNTQSGRSLFDSSGGLTLGGTFDYVKNNLTEKAQAALMIPSMFKTLLDTYKMEENYHPAKAAGGLMGLILTGVLGDKKWFNGNSFNDFQEYVDERVANAQNNMLTKLFNWDKFQKLFGDATRRRGNEDYSRYVENQYNREKAVFDGMTRKTIIDVIPSYLRKITEALTGQTYYVSSSGSLTLDKPGEFQHQLSSAITSGFSVKTIEKFRKKTGTKISNADIHLAQRILTSLYIFNMLKEGIEIYDQSFFEHGGNPEINNHAAELLAAQGKKSRAEWDEVIQFITMQMMSDKNARSSFVRALSQAMRATDSRLQNYAKNANWTADIGQLTQEMMDDEITKLLQATNGDDRTYAERIQAGEMTEKDIPKGYGKNDRPSDEQLRKIQRERMLQAESLTNIGDSFHKSTKKTTDILTSIYSILNRGINVFAVKRGPFKNMPLQSSADDGPKIITPKLPTTAAPTDILPGPTGAEGGTGSGADETGAPASPLERIAKSTENILSNQASKLTSAIANEWENLKSDASIIGNQVFGYGQAEVNKGLLKRDLASLGDSEDDKHDREIANAVLQAMNASVADGDTKEDLGALQQQISDIKNPKLKSRLSNIVEGTMKRSENKKPESSKFGKILGWGLGLIKGFVLPVLSKAKTFITTLGQKLIGPILKSLQSSWDKVKRGATGIKEGLFGSEESDGIFGRIKNRFSGGKASAGNAAGSEYLSARGGAINAVYQAQADGTYTMYNPFEAEDKAAAEHKQKQEQYGWSGGQAGGTVSGGDTSQYQTYEVSNEEATEEKQGNKLQAAMSKLMEKFKSTDFGKGFMSVFEKHNKKEKPAQTLADQASKGILDILKSKDGKADGGDTVLSRIAYGITAVQDVFATAIEKLEAKQSGEGGEADAAGGKSKDKKGAKGKTSDSAESSEGDTSGDKDKTKEGDGKKKKGFSFDLGKILGGMSSILMGIGQAVLTVIASMSGFKAIMELGMNILKTSLAPLNKAFQAIYKALKPVVATVKQILKEIVEYIVQIVEVVIEIIKPILEIIGPIVEQIMEVLRPLLEMITGLVNVLMVPTVALMKTVVVPILQHIGNTLEVTLGVIQVGFGIVMTALGGILTAVGFLTKFFTHDDSAQQRGEQIFSMGTNLVSSGFSSVVSGMKKEVALIGDVITGQTVKDAFTETVEDSKPTRQTQQQDPTYNGSPMDGLYGAGDLNDLYGGSGAQNGYGNYMNMSKRGCGPTALADAYARRSGSRVSPMTVASAMRASGSYSEGAGTSVAGYINASRAMGMNVRPGGVNTASLRQASPTNPITVIGSGPDFTTRRGNNHYMNVVGTSGGTAFVSNPMTGRVERRSVSSLASSSLLGLYGGGDGDAYIFDDDVQDALGTLKKIVSNIINMFVGSTEDSLTEAMNAENDKQAYEQAQVKVAALDLSDEEKQKLDDRAHELFKAENPQRDGESATSYANRYEKNKARYWTMAATEKLREKVNNAANGSDAGAMKMINDTVGEYDPETGEYSKTGSFAKSMFSSLDAIESGGFSNMMSSLTESLGGTYGSSYGTGFYSDKGAKLYTDTYTPTIFENDGTLWRKGGDYSKSGKSYLAEWFENVIDPNIAMSSSYGYYGPPANKDVYGQAGSTHGGTDFTLGGDVPIRATTGGKVVATNGNDPYGDGYGYFAKIEDEGGDFHIYAHMRANPGVLVNVGDTVQPGQQLGLMGNTGNSYGQHLHYEVRLAPGGINDRVNPFTFFKWHEGGGTDSYGRIEYSGQLADGDFWPNYKDQPGAREFIETAFKAGLTGPEIATITSMGIHEDSARKLWGDKSLLAVTHDKNGQAAVGLMNFQDVNGDYGDTVEKQLQYIQKAYFAPDAWHERAKVVRNGYEAQDLEAYIQATGRQGWVLDFGERYGDYMNNTDLIEGSEHYYRGALVPECIHVVEGPRKHIGTAIGVYNWLIDEGYINPVVESITGLPTYDWSYDNYIQDTSMDVSDYKFEAPTGSMYTSANFGIPVRTTTAGSKEPIPCSSLAGTPKKVVTKDGVRYATDKDGNILGKATPVSSVAYGASSFLAAHKGATKVKIAGTEYYVYDFINPYTNAVDFYDCNNSRLCSGVPANSQMLQNASALQGWLSGHPDAFLWTYNGTKYYVYNFSNTQAGVTALNYMTTSSGDIYRSQQTKVYNTTKTPEQKTTYTETVSEAYAKAAKQYPSIEAPMSNSGFKVTMGNVGALVDDAANLGLASISALTGNIGGLQYAIGNLTGADSTDYSYLYESGPSQRPNSSHIDPSIGSTVVATPQQKNTTTTTTTTVDSVAAAVAAAKKGSGDEFTQVINPFSLESFVSLADDDGTQQPIIVNKYATASSAADDKFDAILNNTYNVRSVQIETTLSEMLALMREKNQRARARSKTRVSPNYTPEDKFSEQGIPSQVERLSVG